MTCDRCAVLEDEVAYLRLRLADRLNVNLVRLVVVHFGFTPAEGDLVAALYQARSIVSVYDLELAVKRDHASDYGICANTVHVMVMRIRRKAGYDFVDTVRSLGFALSDTGRKKIAQVIEEDRLAMRPETSPMPIDSTDMMRPQWTRERRSRLQHLLRFEGLSYDEAAKALRVSRGSVASAAARFGYQKEHP